MQKEGQQVNKLRSFRKSVIGGISGKFLCLLGLVNELLLRQNGIVNAKIATWANELNQIV